MYLTVRVACHLWFVAVWGFQCVLFSFILTLGEVAEPGVDLLRVETGLPAGSSKHKVGTVPG